MSEPTITDIVYRTGTHPTEKSWDVMQVVFRNTDAATGETCIVNSCVIALALDGTILLKADAMPERWEIVADEDELRVFRSRFSDRDEARMRDAAAKGAGSL
jgi:hypothetical protein